MREIAWAISVAVMFCALAYCTVQEGKRRTASEIACINAGGSWGRNWGPPRCELVKP